MKNSRVHAGLDALGVSASAICAIHCAALPFLITSLPMWGLGFLADHRFEIVIIIVSLIIGVVSLGGSYIKIHRSIRPLLVLFVGFTLILSAHLLNFGHLEHILGGAGGLMIAFSHYLNWRCNSSCRHLHK